MKKYFSLPQLSLPLKKGGRRDLSKSPLIPLFQRGKFFALFLVLLLSSCGFHLRGNIPLSPHIKHIYLKTESPYSELSRNIRTTFQTSNIDVVSTPDEANVTLAILSTQESQQQTNVSATQQTRQFLLTYTVIFEVQDSKGIPVSLPQTVSETRTFTIKSSETLAGSNEAMTLFQQMHSAVVFDMMTRLSSHQMTKSINEYFKQSSR